MRPTTIRLGFAVVAAVPPVVGPQRLGVTSSGTGLLEPQHEVLDFA
jgi:hypothetical protein